MTPVGDYLKKLLYQYDCLVVPELGAFLTHYLPASFTETTNQYLPPRKRLAFNEALRLDDGILINYIMLHESVTRDEALRYIGQFVSVIKQQIRSAGSHTLDGIGMLTVNEEGKLQFHPELRHNFFAESFGLQPIQAQYCEPTEVSLPVSVVPATTNVSLALMDANQDEGKLMPMPVRRSPWYWAAATLLIGSLATLSYVSVVQPTQLLQSSLSPASLLRLPAFLPKTIEGPASSPKIDKATSTPVTVAEPVVDVRIPAPVLSPKVAPVITAVTATPKKVIYSTKKRLVSVAPKAAARVAMKPFVIIAGSFSSKSNALRLRRQLRKAGFDDAYLMMPVRRRELIKVAAFGATTLSQADTMMAKVSHITRASPWLMRTR